ncbi:transmembrane protein 221 [Latimeria chalumnae]|uniref:Transmembrane protein 221 n=1 Tax=Latimeria chalumnae TaxID=7897 RepID=H3B3X9_LATCH|nr:PREDICTED: transmembrane protein 221 [Latimeria chalumnae]|eukprot:XP_014345954.1 PREDICTED: transmembrane protein 221 [Latimeria chalumnae]
MPSSYTQRSLTVLVLFGLLAALMAVLSVILIFQLQSNQTEIKDSSPSRFSAEAIRILLPVATVLTALALTLNLSCVIVCLLHSCFTTEVCRGDSEPDRSDWFLLDSRTIRHVAIGLFCLGISVYLAALSIYMLLLFEIESGIASACILSSGVIVLLVTVLHSLIKASHAVQRSRAELTNTMFENDSAQGEDLNTPDLNSNKEVVKPRLRPDIHREFSYPPYVEQKPQYLSPTASQVASTGSQATTSSQMVSTSEKEAYNAPRMHRTLSAESGLLQAQAKPWNGVTHEMRTVLAHKPGVAGKDSTLV